ncbi:hypothetical protein [Paenibacillus taiwanensis]|uniref:hypothetical protein n=1 Tax=Paenibacillus taiwanensis TaxID=401638 RepID=UPI0012F92323|nr:hypothetical protein [Paenibacillus taiwanensis]
MGKSTSNVTRVHTERYEVRCAGDTYRSKTLDWARQYAVRKCIPNGLPFVIWDLELDSAVIEVHVTSRSISEYLSP